VQVVARQQNNVADSKDEFLAILTVDPDAEFTLGYVMIENRLDAGPRTGAQCSGAMRAAIHHGAEKSACRKTPPVKCATLKTSDNASIPALLSDTGVLVMSHGAPVIDPPASGGLKISASADRVAFANGATQGASS